MFKFLSTTFVAAFGIFLFGCAAYHEGTTKVAPPQPIENIYQSTLNKDQIYSKCMEWIAKSFVSGKDVVQLSDKENGKIICKGNMEIDAWWHYGLMGSAKPNETIRFTMTIGIKEGKFKIVFDDFISEDAYANTATPTYKKEVDQINEKCQQFSKEINEFMTTNNKKDDF